MSVNTYRYIKKQINKHNNMILTTSVESIPEATEINYVNDGFTIYCYVHRE